MSLYDHFRKEERPFIDQVLDWKATVEEEYRSKLSDFLDPRQQKILSSIVGTDTEVKFLFHGGASLSERKRALLYPDYMEPDTSDFEMKAYELIYPAKFASIDHPQVLGTLTSLGVKREKFGDIIIDNQRIQLIVAKEISVYIEQQFTSVGKVNLLLEEIPLDELLHVEEESSEITVTVSSLRLDVVLAEAFRLSRTKVKPFIQSEKVKVNWKIIQDPSLLVESGDMLSLRGKGRCKVTAVEGITKKGKRRVTLQLIGGRK